jgi:hypothetical protein
MALMKQSSNEPTMEEKLLGPQAAQSLTSQGATVPTNAPTNLADALAKQGSTS